MNKPSKYEFYMRTAEIAATMSHDSETKVGSVLVNINSGAIIATGCNGFVRGADDVNLPNSRPDKYDYIVHSEMNLIANCARHGISTDNCFVVCTLTPCKMCMRVLWQSGIKSVICKHIYKDFTEILQMKDLNLDISTTDENYIVLKYSNR